MKKKYTKTDIVLTIIFLGIAIYGFTFFVHTISSTNSKSTKTSYDYAKDGYRKQQNGEPLSRNEREALESYNEWEEKQRDKE